MDGDHWPRKKPLHPRAAKPPAHGGITRRNLLASAALLIATSGATARTVMGVLPWKPNEAYPVPPVVPGGWLFFTPNEAAIVDAFVDRLIPGDHLSPGGKDCGVAVYIDRQLAGSFGGQPAL